MIRLRRPGDLVYSEDASDTESDVADSSFANGDTCAVQSSTFPEMLDGLVRHGASRSRFGSGSRGRATSERRTGPDVLVTWSLPLSSDTRDSGAPAAEQPHSRARTATSAGAGVPYPVTEEGTDHHLWRGAATEESKEVWPPRTTWRWCHESSGTHQHSSLSIGLLR